jgi:hypothetical protein
MPKKYKHGWRLRIKIYILFYGDSSRTIAHEPLHQTKFGAVKDHRLANKFYLNNHSDESFKYGDGAKF